MAKKDNEYFEGFVRLVEHSCQAAEYLKTALENFDASSLPGQMEELHAIEHKADDDKHTLMQKLVKEFVTPIEREDIIQLANEIDDVTDCVEDILIRVYMYNVTEMRHEALAFADVIYRCCLALRAALRELPEFHKSKTLHQAIVDVNTLEEEGDGIYIKAMRNLYTTETDPVKVVAWSETFDRLEDCCDACEEVASVMETVIMKNT